MDKPRFVQIRGSAAVEECDVGRGILNDIGAAGLAKYDFVTLSRKWHCIIAVAKNEDIRSAIVIGIRHESFAWMH